MRTLKLFVSDPSFSLNRRRRALASSSATKKAATAAKNPTGKSVVINNKKTSKAGSTKTTATKPTTPSAAATTTKTVLNNTITTTSCNERLHLVLARRSRVEMQELSLELRAHAAVKTVCVYTDAPLVSSRAPLSQRQQSSLLKQVVETCSKMTTLQLDFSSEFGPQSEVVLECDLLACLLQNAPQLKALLLKDVALQGDAAILRSVLLHHPNLTKVELKWCSEAPSAASDSERGEDTVTEESGILHILLETVTQLTRLEELTLLFSSAHNLPLHRLAHSSSLKRLTLGLEQRHVSVVNVASVEHRHAEQAQLMFFLQDLAANTTLTECTLFSHHWKSASTLDLVCQVIASPTSNLHLFSLTDYNYGSDDPRQLLELAGALQINKRLQKFKLFSKKRLSSQVDKKTRRTNASAIDAAFVEALEQNTSLQYLDIVHAGIHISDAIKSRMTTTISCKNCSCTTSATSSAAMAAAKQQKQMIPFYLLTNRCQARQQFLLQPPPTGTAWRDFCIQHKDNTPLLFYLLQENPNLLALSSSPSSLIPVPVKKQATVPVVHDEGIPESHRWEYYV